MKTLQETGMEGDRFSSDVVSRSVVTIHRQRKTSKVWENLCRGRNKPETTQMREREIMRDEKNQTFFGICTERDRWMD